MNKRLIYPDFLRVLSAIFVILIHITTIGIRELERGSLGWGISLGYNTISRWAVPIFFMISGMFFLNPDREFSVKKLWSKNITKIVLCLVFWGCFYSILDQYVYGTLSFKTIFITIYGIITDNTGYHLWFLYVLLMLYIGIPIFRIITENASKRQLEYILIVWFVVFICMGHINGIVAELFGIERLFPYEAYPISGNAGYFLLGYYLYKYPLGQKIRRYFSLLSIAGGVIMVMANIVLSNWRQVSSINEFLSPNNIVTCLIAITLFSCGVGMEEKLQNSKYVGFICNLANVSMGVYLVHVFWITLIYHILEMKVDFITPILSVPLMTVVIFLLSLISSWILRKIPGLRKTV